MPTHYSDDYERITGKPVPADAHPRLAPEPLNNRVRDDEPSPVEVVSVVETKDVKPAEADTK
jgi:hypothetical protein